MNPANDNEPMTPKEIQSARKKAGMSNRELADYLGMSVNTLRKITLGKQKAGPDTIAALEALALRGAA